MQQTQDLIPLTMRYKGDRNYLHGTDIYPAVISAVVDHCGMGDYAGHLAFHHFAHSQCDMFISADSKNVIIPEGRVCDGRFYGSKGEWVVWLMETDRQVKDRYAFDEDEICAAAVISEKTIRVTKSLTYSPIEIVVALTKHLHNLLFPLTDQRWIFSKLEFSRLLPTKGEDVRVKLLMNLHNRITKSELRFGDEVFGNIYFSAVAK